MRTDLFVMICEAPHTVVIEAGISNYMGEPLVRASTFNKVRAHVRVANGDVTASFPVAGCSTLVGTISVRDEVANPASTI